MKIFYLRDNMISVGEARTEDGGRSVIPPENHRLVTIKIGSHFELCAVKKNDYRYTLEGLGNSETIALSKVAWTKPALDLYEKKVVWTKSAAALYEKYKKSAVPKGKKTEPEAKKTPGRQTLLSVLPLKTPISLNHSSGDFEKNFKSLVREQGSGASSLMTAKFLVYSMPPGDKSELNKNLLSNGVKGPDDLKRLLSKWRSEALLANQKPEQTLHRKKSLSAGYER
jgi:hypothetical protein